MLDKIKNSILNSPQVAGLEIRLQKDGSRQFNICILEQKGSEIKILSKAMHLQSIEDLPNHIDKSIPVVLSISGKGLIQKKVPSAPLDPIEFLQKALPNANAEDLCFELTSGPANTWVSIIRNDVVQKLLDDLESAGLSIQKMHLGLGAVKSLLPLLPTETQSIDFGSYQVNLLNGNVESVTDVKTMTTDSIDIEGTTIDLNLLPAFSAALGQVLRMEETAYPSSLLQASKSNYYYQRLTKVMGWFLLISFFVLLLINTLIFTQLSQKNAQQSVALSHHKTQLDELNTLRAQYEEKASFFENNNMLKSSKVSYYADQIGMSVPDGLQLSDLEIFPLLSDKRNKIGAQLTFNSSTILISGRSQRSMLLNGWIRSLQGNDWVSKVNVLPYAEGADGVGEFLLEVVLE